MRVLLVPLVALGIAACSDPIFHPMREHVLTPDELGLDYEDVRFEADDGTSLHGWFLPADGERHGSVLFLHGNAQNISTHIRSVAWMPDAGFDVFLVDYRGYGKSEGEPDLDGLHRDLDAALSTLLDRPNVEPDRVAVFGQSLGAAVAITGLARQPEPERLAALVVEGAFTGYRALARDVLADLWLTWPLQGPLALMIDDRHRPIEAIGDLAGLPVLIIHGEADEVVPVHHGIALFEAADEPKGDRPRPAGLRTVGIRAGSTRKRDPRSVRAEPTLRPRRLRTVRDEASIASPCAGETGRREEPKRCVPLP